MSADDKPRFSVWLGDNWPGRYVVSYEGKSGGKLTIVVNGVASMPDALAVAQAEYHVSEEDFPNVSIVTAGVAEASHHLPLLAERRAARGADTPATQEGQT